MTPVDAGSDQRQPFGRILHKSDLVRLRSHEAGKGGAHLLAALIPPPLDRGVNAGRFGDERGHRPRHAPRYGGDAGVIEMNEPFGDRKLAAPVVPVHGAFLIC